MRETLEACINRWLDDPDSSVEYAEQLEGRWAVRMRQDARDATTVWFEVGERSLKYEAYVMPLPEGSTGAYHQALRRNITSWRCFFAIDAEGGLVLRGRLPEQSVTSVELDFALGEIYETLEVAFRPLLKAAYGIRENSG
jgi:hypothetical protein